MNALSKIEKNQNINIDIAEQDMIKYQIISNDKDINNFENLVIAEFKRIVKDFMLFVDEKWADYMKMENKNEEDVDRCNKFKELKSSLWNDFLREEKIIKMAENKSNVLTVEFKKTVNLSISLNDISGGVEMTRAIQRNEYNAIASLIGEDFTTLVFSRTVDGDFKSIDFAKNFQLEFRNFSILSWIRTLNYFIKARPEKSPSFNEILKVVEMYDYSNFSLQKKINFLAIFKK
jgi:hypothetical protein